MKIKILFVFVFLVLNVSFAWAQQAVVIKLEGSVDIKIDTTSSWQKAQEGQLLKAQSQVKTGPTGKVTIAFGPDRSNIIMIEKNTETVIEQIKPGAVYLPKGRVFTIIRDLSQIENFEIKTPTAVAGARGTGWVTEVVDGKTEISVFDDIVAVRGFDENGKETAQFDIQEDFVASVSLGGNYEEPEPVSEGMKEELHRMEREIIQIVQEFDPSLADRNFQRQGAKDANQMPLMPLKDMGQLLENMKQSGQYSAQEIMDMEKLLLNGVDPMNPDEMFKVMEKMGEMGLLSPEEQNMMAEISENQEAMKNMSPEEREQYIHSLEEKYGVQRNGPDGDEFRSGFGGPTGDGRGMTPQQDMMQREVMDNAEMIEQMSSEERQAYFAQMEEKYGLAPFQPEGGNYTDPAFGAYMDQFGTNPNGPPPEGFFDYSQDSYFGEFDQQWDTAGGNFVTQPPYDPLKDNIDDRPFCSCACTGPDCGFNCKPVYCPPPSSP